MKILISGSSGLIGSALTGTLRARGDEVVRLVRTESSVGADVFWDPQRGILDSSRLEGLDGVVHLAGENIAGRRWSEAVKAGIRDSRVNGTSLLASALSRLKQPPSVFVSASAIGYYGDTGSRVVDEESPAGDTFLAQVCVDWEKAADAARDVGIRVVHPRFGVVLSPTGGALARMLLPFRLGLGGRLGNGAAWMSWVSLSDAVKAVEVCLTGGGLSGPVNVVSPSPVTNAEFTRTLATVLRRPAVLPVPRVVIATVFGEMGRELLLASARVHPVRLARAGFQFSHPDLTGALRSMLERENVG